MADARVKPAHDGITVEWSRSASGSLHRRLELHGPVALTVMNAELPLFRNLLVGSLILRRRLAQRVLGAADGAVDIGAVVDGDRFVDHVALDVAAGIDVNVNAADRTDDPPT